MARPWCDTHTPLFTFLSHKKERALSRNQKPENTHEYVLQPTYFTYLRDWDDAKKRHCSAAHPALILHHPRVLHKPCKGSISWMLIQRLKHRMKFQKRRECVPHPLFRRACSLSYSGYNIHVHT